MRSAFLRVLLAAALPVFMLCLVMGMRMLMASSRQLEPNPPAVLELDAGQVVQRLAGAVRIQSISRDDAPDAHANEILVLHAYLRQHFPKVFAQLTVETVSGRSLLLYWPGGDPLLAPAMFMAHMDVVPIAPGTEQDWTHPPFDGVIADGFVWGRGAWDDKSQVLGLLEALERLLADGLKPTRGIYLAFGHDEETGGAKGARAIAELLESRGIRLDFVLDEGLVIANGLLAGVSQPTALIGAAEKGYLTLELSVNTAPGHSSMPTAQSAIGRLSNAIVRLEKSPLPASIDGMSRALFDAIAPEMDLLPRLVLSNLWLTEPLVRAQLLRKPSTAAMLRTTTAPTVIAGGNKENVLPANAHALVNFRIRPGDTSESVIRFVQGIVADPAVRIEVFGTPHEPLPDASISSLAYRRLSQSIRDIYPETLVAPGLMIAAADGRHMGRIARDIYRFSPIHARPQDLSRFHGTNERIGIDEYLQMIRFYHRLIQLSTQAAKPDNR